MDTVLTYNAAAGTCSRFAIGFSFRDRYQRSATVPSRCLEEMVRGRSCLSYYERTIFGAAHLVAFLRRVIEFSSLHTHGARFHTRLRIATPADSERAYLKLQRKS